MRRWFLLFVLVVGCSDAFIEIETSPSELACTRGGAPECALLARDRNGYARLNQLCDRGVDEACWVGGSDHSPHRIMDAWCNAGDDRACLRVGLLSRATAEDRCWLEDDVEACTALLDTGLSDLDAMLDVLEPLHTGAGVLRIPRLYSGDREYLIRQGRLGELDRVEDLVTHIEWLLEDTCRRERSFLACQLVEAEWATEIQIEDLRIRCEDNHQVACDVLIGDGIGDRHWRWRKVPDPMALEQRRVDAEQRCPNGDSDACMRWAALALEHASSGVDPRDPLAYLTFESDYRLEVMLDALGAAQRIIDENDWDNFEQLARACDRTNQYTCRFVFERAAAALDRASTSELRRSTPALRRACIEDRTQFWCGVHLDVAPAAADPIAELAASCEHDFDPACERLLAMAAGHDLVENACDDAVYLGALIRYYGWDAVDAPTAPESCGEQRPYVPASRELVRTIERAIGLPDVQVRMLENAMLLEGVIYSQRQRERSEIVARELYAGRIASVLEIRSLCRGGYGEGRQRPSHMVP